MDDIISGVGVLDGLLYAVGGHDGPLVRKSVEVFNPDSNCWSPVADMNLCRRNAGKCKVGRYEKWKLRNETFCSLHFCKYMCLRRFC